MIQTPAISIVHTDLRRLFRVGSTAALEVAVSYPSLTLADEKNKLMQQAISRFNEAYLAMAEAFLGWCEGTPAEDAKSDFAAAGIGAVYTFDRRIVTCRMVAVSEEDSGVILVRRTVTRGSRRGGASISCEQTDRWRADLSLIPGRGRRIRPGKSHLCRGRS